MQPQSPLPDPPAELDIGQRIKKTIEELEILERGLYRMRMECEQRYAIWDVIQSEMAVLEEQATIYRYKMDKTQDQPTEKGGGG